MTKSFENRLHLKMRLYRFQLKGEISISDHINIYTTLLADLANLDVVIDDEDKTILLSSLSDEGYETFVLTLINGRTSLSYKEVTTTLVNLKLRRKDKEYSTSGTSAEVLTARESNPKRRRENQYRSNWKFMVGNCQLKRISMLSVKRKDTEIVIIQGSVS